VRNASVAIGAIEGQQCCQLFGRVTGFGTYRTCPRLFEMSASGGIVLQNSAGPGCRAYL